MEVGSPEWIEASLARLDDLERQRGEHESALEDADDPAVLKRHTEALERLDAELKTLYAQLEAIADDEDEDGESEEAPSPEEGSPVATQADDELSAPHLAPTAPAPAPEPAPAAAPAPVAAAMAAPVAQAADNPFASPSDFGGGGGGFDAPTPVSISDDDLKPKGGGAKWAFLIVVLLGGVGVGGFFLWQNMQANKPAPTAPEEPPVVIKAVGVPDDTEAPPTVPGGTATISPTANLDNGANSKKKKKEDEKKAKPIKLKTGDGPL